MTFSFGTSLDGGPFDHGPQGNAVFASKDDHSLVISGDDRRVLKRKQRKKNSGDAIIELSLIKTDL